MTGVHREERPEARQRAERVPAVLEVLVARARVATAIRRLPERTGALEIRCRRWAFPRAGTVDGPR